jgi:hypothetical protein
MFNFGVGTMWGRPTGGNAASPSFPQQFGSIQDVGIDFEQKLLELRGQKKAPDDVAPGDLTIKGKAGFGRIDINIYNSLFFAETITAGIKIMVPNEPQTISGNKATASGNASYYRDLGVAYADGSGYLQQVSAGNEGPGLYSVVESGNNKGEYTFDSSDNNKAVQLSYVISDGNNGSTMTVTNRLQGYGPTFEMWLMQPYQGTNGLHLFACRASKMSAPAKRDGYTISDLEFEVFADASDNLFEWFQISRS